MSLQLTRLERRIALDISRIFAFRMLGLFMILPIFSAYAAHLMGATPLLIGIALGIYGLASALMQAPMGWLSDKIGRKKVISLGLVLFLLGSLLAGVSHSIDGIIIGRFLQGFGAIGSSLLALLADNTREEIRFRAMSLVGMTIGLSFIISMALGPLLSKLIGLSGLFYFMGFLAVLGLVLLWARIPSGKPVFHPDQEFCIHDVKKIFKSLELWRLNIGIFVLHAVLMATFVIFPVLLINKLAWPLAQHWEIYLPVLIISFGLMFPFIIWSEKKHQLKKLMIGSVGLLILLELGFFYWGYFLSNAFWFVIILLILFFGVFTLLEASLPSLSSKIAPPNAKGTAMGIYSTMQFLGAFFGGALGGYFYEQAAWIFLGAAFLSLIWWILVINMEEPVYLANRMVHIGSKNTEEISSIKNSLEKIEGVRQVYIDAASGIAYLKVETAHFVDENIFGYSVNILDPSFNSLTFLEK